MKKGFVVTGIIAGVLAVGYGAGCYYFSHHFFPNTTLNGMNVSYQDSQSVQSALTALDDSKLTILEREEKSETISLQKIDYDVSLPLERVEEVLQSQNLFTWPAAFFGTDEREVTVDYAYDSKKLETQLASLKALDEEKMTAPTDAYVSIIEDTYGIVEEEMGTTLDVELTKSVIEDALKHAQLELNLEEAQVYANPTVYAEDESLQKQLALLAKVNNEIITIDVIGDSTTIDAQTMLKLLQEDENGSIVVNEDALNSYVDWLENTYNTYKTSRQFTTVDKTVIDIGGGSQDSYGFLLSYDSSKNAIRDALYASATQTITVYWDLVGHTRNSVNEDIGTTYIEINISTQQLYYFVDGEIVYQSNVITGLPQHNQNTPTGVFRIWAKQRNAQLKGTAWDGKEWDSTVSYWMPIDWTGVGLHDATWQSWSSWYTSAYTTVGSHGCVNLPYYAAEYLYYNTIDECPVIIHY